MNVFPGNNADIFQAKKKNGHFDRFAIFAMMFSTAFCVKVIQILHCLVERQKKKKTFNLLPKDKILDLSKLKTFANDRITENKKPKFSFGSEENIGKGENAGYQHFLLFQ